MARHGTSHHITSHHTSWSPHYGDIPAPLLIIHHTYRPLVFTINDVGMACGVPYLIASGDRAAYPTRAGRREVKRAQILPRNRRARLRFAAAPKPEPKQQRLILFGGRRREPRLACFDALVDRAKHSQQPEGLILDEW